MPHYIIKSIAPEINIRDIDISKPLIDELQIDSIDYTRLIERVERKFNISIDNPSLTLRDLCQLKSM